MKVEQGCQSSTTILKTFSKATTAVASMMIDTSLISGTCGVKHTGGKRSTGI